METNKHIVSIVSACCYPDFYLPICAVSCETVAKRHARPQPYSFIKGRVFSVVLRCGRRKWPYPLLDQTICQHAHLCTAKEIKSSSISWLLHVCSWGKTGFPPAGIYDLQFFPHSELLKSRAWDIFLWSKEGEKDCASLPSSGNLGAYWANRRPGFKYLTAWSTLGAWTRIYPLSSPPPLQPRGWAVN